MNFCDIAPAAADSNVDFGQFGKYPNTISFKTIVARFARKMTLRKSVIVIGGGIMSLGTSLQLVDRGYKVTLLEKQSDVAKVASYINGAMICPSMTATWASLKLLSQVFLMIILNSLIESHAFAVSLQIPFDFPDFF